MINRVILVGRVGKDPEVKYTQSGTSVAKFSVATSEYSKDKKETTEWHNIVCFNGTADAVGKYLKKGGLVYVAGSIHTNKWEDKTGNTRYTTEIRAGEVKFLSGKSKTPEVKEEESDDADDLLF